MLRPVARTIVPKLIVSTRASSLLFVARDRMDAAFPTLLRVGSGEPCAEPCAEPRDEPRDGEWFRVGTSSSSAIKFSYSWLVQDSATDSGAEPSCEQSESESDISLNAAVMSAAECESLGSDSFGEPGGGGDLGGGGDP
jgi:hypothetical protein